MMSNSIRLIEFTIRYRSSKLKAFFLQQSVSDSVIRNFFLFFAITPIQLYSEMPLPRSFRKYVTWRHKKNSKKKKKIFLFIVTNLNETSMKMIISLLPYYH